MATFTPKSDSEATAFLASIPTTFYKLTVSAKRNPNLTPAQFYDRWINVYGPKAAVWMKKYGAYSYTQVQVRALFSFASPSHPTDCVKRAAASHCFANTHKYHTREEDKAKLAVFGFPTDEWDGKGEVLFKDLSLFEQAFQDPEYLQVLKLEEEQLLDQAEGGRSATLGFEVVLIEGGEVLEKPKFR